MLRYLSQIYLQTLQTLDSKRLVSERLRSHTALATDVLAVGKAATAMACGAKSTLGSALARGFVLTKDEHIKPADRAELGAHFLLREAAHPVPNESGLKATLELKSWLTESQTKRLMVLLSGGASSLLVSPSPPLKLDDLKAINTALLACGLSIESINILRKHLSQVKGGQLAEYCAPFYDSIEQMLMVDICAPDFSPAEVNSLVGSGPFLADPSTLRQAESILNSLAPRLSEACTDRARRALKETPKQNSVETVVLASHLEVHQTARRHLGDDCLEVEDWPSPVTSEVQDLARELVRVGKDIKARGLTGVLVSCGEPTVTLTSEKAGMGGRCQELALHVAKQIAGVKGLTFLAGSTDGTDGPSPYAGAVVDGESWPQLCRLLGSEAAETALNQHQSSKLLEQLPESHLKTGPTGQNLNDLFLLAVGEKTQDPAHIESKSSSCPQST